MSFMLFYLLMLVGLGAATRDVSVLLQVSDESEATSSLLDAAVKSLHEQTLKPSEIVVLDMRHSCSERNESRVLGSTKIREICAKRVARVVQEAVSTSSADLFLLWDVADQFDSARVETQVAPILAGKAAMVFLPLDIVFAHARGQESGVSLFATKHASVQKSCYGTVAFTRDVFMRHQEQHRGDEDVQEEMQFVVTAAVTSADRDEARAITLPPGKVRWLQASKSGESTLKWLEAAINDESASDLIVSVDPSIMPWLQLDAYRINGTLNRRAMNARQAPEGNYAFNAFYGYYYAGSCPADTLFEPNNECENAPFISKGVVYSDLLATASDDDYYEFFVDAHSAALAFVTFTHSEGDIDIALFESCEAGSIASSFGIADFELIAVNNDRDQDALLRLYAYLWSGDVEAQCNKYSIEIVRLPPTFVGYFTPENWRNDPASQGSVSHTAGLLTLLGPNTGSFVYEINERRILIPFDGTVFFHWAFVNYDFPGWDFPVVGLFRQGELFVESFPDGYNLAGTSIQLGQHEIVVQAGDMLFLSADTVDSIFGPGEFSIWDFQYETSPPGLDLPQQPYWQEDVRTGTTQRESFVKTKPRDPSAVEERKRQQTSGASGKDETIGTVFVNL